MQNLRDKLLKAGLVTQEQTRLVQEAPPKRTEIPRQTPRPPPTGAMARPVVRNPRPFREPQAPVVELPVPKLPPLPGSKAHHRLEALRQRERDEKLRAIVLSAEVPIELGGHAFHFVTRKGRLRRLELSESQAKALEEGKLAVVERQEPAQIEHSLVPPEAAERLLELFPKAVRFLAKAGHAVGFLTEEELRAHQAAEATAGPEIPEPAAKIDDSDLESSSATPVPATPSPTAPLAAVQEGEVLIAVRRAPK